MRSIDKLLELMVQLRDAQHGCPWDRRQSFSSIAPYTVEEAYEVADAIARDDRAGLCEELGDLLFQVVFHARMAEEQGSFDFEDVVRGICEKLQRRHPHLFGTEDEQRTAACDWERIKADERASRANDRVAAGALDGIALALPALLRAAKLGQRASLQGFDWPDAAGAKAKIAEELAELAEAVNLQDRDAIEEELGDVLFSVVNLARHLDVDPEQALTGANRKFERRFHCMEASLRAAGKEIEALSAHEVGAAWQQAKQTVHDRT